MLKVSGVVDADAHIDDVRRTPERISGTHTLLSAVFSPLQFAKQSRARTRQRATEARSGACANSRMPSSKRMVARKPMLFSASLGEAKT